MFSGRNQEPDPQGSPEQDAVVGFGADRRGFICGALLAIGVSGVSLSGCSLLADSGADTDQFFNPARFAVLDTVAETIIPRTDTPGARDAMVPQRLDRLMSGWASKETQSAFTALLDEIEAAAKAHDPQGLAAMSATRQLDVVSAFDQSKQADPAYRKFKNLVLALYYISEPGATQELRYEHVPGAWEPSIAVTPDTRAWAIDVSA